MLGGKRSAKDMFTEPVGIPCRAIAGGGQESVVERKDDFVQPGSPHLRGQHGAILTPGIVLKPLLPVIVIPPDNRLLRSPRVQIVDGKGAKCG